MRETYTNAEQSHTRRESVLFQPPLSRYSETGIILRGPEGKTKNVDNDSLVSPGVGLIKARSFHS